VFCTNSHDGAQLQAAMKCQGSVVRPHGTCDVDANLTGTNIGFEGADAQLNIESGFTQGVTMATGANQYNAMPWDNLTINGTGAANSNCFNLAGNFTAIHNLSCQGFTQLVGVQSNGYNDDFYSAKLYNGGQGIFCGGGLNNAGEGIRFYGGAIFNLVSGFFNSACQLSFVGTHFDGLSNVIGAGPFNCTDCSIEEFTNQPTGGVMFSLSGVNAFSGINFMGGGVAQDNATNVPLITITNVNGVNPAISAPFAKFTNVFVRGVGVTVEGNGVTMSADPNLALCGVTSAPNNNGGFAGDVPNSGSCP
jgi:hypothetical protein